MKIKDVVTEANEKTREERLLDIINFTIKSLNVEAREIEDVYPDPADIAYNLRQQVKWMRKELKKL